MSKSALITGITGQDGSYLTELLLEKGYTVHGLVRRSSSFNTGRIDHLYEDPHDEGRSLVLHHADLGDGVALVNLLRDLRPDEVYNLGAQSHVRVSFDSPLYTGDVTGMGTVRLLEAIRASGIDTRIYQASSSEMFGQVVESPQSELTSFHPRSPYGVAKAYGHYITQNYRESFGMYGVSGILFNHESPRRGAEFVTRKISLAVAQIKLGLQDKLALGNLDAVRDWGFAGDYVRAMHLMLSQDSPADYVIGTGRMHSVREAARIAFECVGLDWEQHVVVDPALVRPAEVETLCADCGKAREVLGWEQTVEFPELIQMMVESDLRMAGQTRDHGKLLTAASW